MQKNENGLIAWFKQPSTWWKIGAVVFAGISMYYNLNYRIVALEEFKSEVNIVKIETTLAEMQRDIQRIRNDLQKNR